MKSEIAPMAGPQAATRPSKTRRLGNRAPAHNGWAKNRDGLLFRQTPTCRLAERPAEKAARPYFSRSWRRGDLLREAVERTEAGDQHAAVDRQHAAARKAVGEDRRGRVVLRAPEG